MDYFRVLLLVYVLSAAINGIFLFVLVITKPFVILIPARKGYGGFEVICATLSFLLLPVFNTIGSIYNFYEFGTNRWRRLRFIMRRKINSVRTPDFEIRLNEPDRGKKKNY